MGKIDVTLKIQNIDKPGKVYEGDFLVDTGAKYTVLPENVWKALDLKPERNQKFSLADGSTVQRPVSSAYIKYGSIQAPSTVILGKKKDSQLLGVFTLEAMGLTISPFTREIYPDKLMTL